MVGDTLPTRSVSRGTRLPREIPLTRNGVNLFAGLWLPGRNGTQFCQFHRYFSMTTPAKLPTHTAWADAENVRDNFALPVFHYCSCLRRSLAWSRRALILRFISLLARLRCRIHSSRSGCDPEARGSVCGGIPVYVKLRRFTPRGSFPESRKEAWESTICELLPIQFAPLLRA